MGDDVRWVGNERGIGRETEWSATALMPHSYAGADESYAKLGIKGTGKDLGSRALLLRRLRHSIGIRRKWMCLSVRDGSIMPNRTTR